MKHVLPLHRPVIWNRRALYSTPWFTVQRKDVRFPPPARLEHYYVIRPSDNVNIMAMTRDHRVLLVRQFRPAVEDFTLEFPSGHRDAHESPLAAAKRELYEETGHRTSKLDFLGKMLPDTGRLTNTVWCYLATRLTASPTSRWQPETGIQVIALPARELLNYVSHGKMRHSYDLAALAMAISKKGWGLLHGKP